MRFQTALDHVKSTSEQKKINETESSYGCVISGPGYANAYWFLRRDASVFCQDYLTGVELEWFLRQNKEKTKKLTRSKMNIDCNCAKLRNAILIHL